MSSGFFTAEELILTLSAPASSSGATSFTRLANEGQQRGAGEILFTSMDHDGTQNGFAIDPAQKLGKLLEIPIIASGGAGKKEDFLAVFTLGEADAALAAGVFHFGKIQVPALKNYLAQNGIAIRQSN